MSGLIINPYRFVDTGPAYVTSGDETTDAGTHTFSSVSFDEVATYVLAIYCDMNGTPTTFDVTVDAVSCTRRVHADTVYQGEQFALYEIDISTAGDYDIVISDTTRTIRRSGFDLFNVKDLNWKSGSDTVDQYNFGTTSTISMPTTQTISNTAGSALISSAYAIDGSVTGFTGSDGLSASPNNERDIESGRWLASFIAPDTAGGSEDFTIDVSGASVAKAMISGVWE